MTKEKEKRWDPWRVDRDSISDGGVQIRVLDKEGDGYNESSWAKLTGRDVDWMIRQLVREMQGSVS